jgi:hypothetical protein
MIEASYGLPLVAATGTTGMVGRRAKELFPELGWDPLAVDITDTHENAQVFCLSGAERESVSTEGSSCRH